MICEFSYHSEIFKDGLKAEQWYNVYLSSNYRRYIIAISSYVSYLSVLIWLEYYIRQGVKCLLFNNEPSATHRTVQKRQCPEKYPSFFILELKAVKSCLY